MPLRRRQKALTLLEVLLALSLFVLLASLTWPVLSRPLADQRLRSSVDDIRMRWADARVQAISTGRIYSFRCVVGSSRFLVESQISMDAATADASDADVADPSREGASTAPEERRLEEKTQFGAIEVLPEDGRESDAAANSAISPLEASAWSPPLLFFPDGTTSHGSLRIDGENGRSIELTIRGLTGVVTVGKIKTRGEAGL